MRQITRDTLLLLINTANEISDLRFARKVALAWLAIYPGDLAVKLAYAQALLEDRSYPQALSILNQLCAQDPQYLNAWETLALIQKKVNDPHLEKTLGICRYLRNINNQLYTESTPEPEWIRYLLKANEAMAQRSIDSANLLIQKALQKQPTNPLVGITHLTILNNMGQNQNKNEGNLLPEKSILNLNSQKISSLVEYYHQKWPDCLQFSLILAQTHLDCGKPEIAVDLIHQVATADVGGQIPLRLWGKNHPFISLWPENLVLVFDYPIPSKISAALGWNRLPDPSDKQRYPESINTLIKNFNANKNAKGKKIENSKTSFAHYDGRFPVYIIFTTHSGLKNKFGKEKTNSIKTGMEKVAKAIKKHRGWDSRIIYGDNPDLTSPELQLTPANPTDPSSLQLLLTNLDGKLRDRGEMIGALLIVGGPDIVPFHFLPNPMDDEDQNIPTDNPYGVRDSNVFVPEWPVGRLPEGNEKDINYLQKQLENIVERHSILSKNQNYITSLWKRILAFIGMRQANLHSSAGYSAEIWKRSSQRIFRSIGEPKTLLISPPFEIHPNNTGNGSSLPYKHRLGRLMYFNLHGLPDSEYWYGQRDPFQKNETNDGSPDYPIALKPSDLLNGGKAPEIVFSEACYGAHIIKKNIDDSLALKFISTGTQALIGSTVAAYGTVNNHLVAADLLSYGFWQALHSGITVGEAFRKAKIFLAQEMHQRQGYLDSGDQKTLLSFILYGDPLSRPSELSNGIQPKSLIRPPITQREIKAICNNHLFDNQSQLIEKEILLSIKQIVKNYLPDMKDAELSIKEHMDVRCDSECGKCPLVNDGLKSPKAKIPAHKIVTMRKSIPSSNLTHHHFAHVTFSPKGKITKIMVSK